MMFLGILGLLGFLVFILAAIVYAIKKNPRWKKCLGIAGICVVVFFVGALNDTTEATDTTKGETEQQEIFNFTDAEITAENIRQAFSDLDEAEEITDIEVDGGIVAVYYQPESSWDEKHYVQQNCRAATSVCEILFSNPRVAEVSLRGHAEMTDAKGNSSVTEVFNVTLAKENAADINWPKFKDMVYVDYMKLLNIADEYYIAPGIARELD